MVAMVATLFKPHAEIDPEFACSAGKHFDMRTVNGVATLACF
jgi:hypothetical protein